MAVLSRALEAHVRTLSTELQCQHAELSYKHCQFQLNESLKPDLHLEALASQQVYVIPLSLHCSPQGLVCEQKDLLFHYS